MRRILSRFARSEKGAVTVDWVVLTGVLAGLGAFIAIMLGEAATDESAGIGAHLEAQTVYTGTN